MLFSAGRFFRPCLHPASFFYMFLTVRYMFFFCLAQTRTLDPLMFMQRFVKKRSNILRCIARVQKDFLIDENVTERNFVED